MSDSVDISKSLARGKRKMPSIAVDKADDLTYDLGNLMAVDPHPVDATEYRDEANRDEYLKKEARDNVQLLFTGIFSLETTRVDSVSVLAELPRPTTRIPREKPVPQPKPETKWEKFAKLKGIQTKKKKSRMVFDEELGEYRPRWGYKRANDPLDKQNWVIEGKSYEKAGDEDPFLKLKREKRERIAKEKLKQNRNKAAAAAVRGKSLNRALKTSVELTDESDKPPTQPTRKDKRNAMLETLNKTRVSTASLGRFDPLVENDKRAKIAGKRQRFEPLIEPKKDERDHNLRLLDRILGKEGDVVVHKAIRHHNVEQHQKKKRKVK